MDGWMVMMVMMMMMMKDGDSDISRFAD